MFWSCYYWVGNSSIMKYQSVFICALVFTQVVGIFFLEHPRNMTVTEGGSVTFRCSVINSSFALYWLVNGSGAGHTIFQERGVSIVPINSTTSTLQIIGHVINNNTLVSCVAARFGLHRVWVPSENAALLVLAKPTDQDPMFSPTLTLTLQKSKIPNSSKALPQETVYDSTKGQSAKGTASFEVIGATVASSIVLMAVAVVVILFVIGCRIRLKKHKGKVKSGESSANAIELQSNVIYEYRKPVPCQQNPAYDLVSLRTSK